jgi:glycosyltransferase involved in cell wall biosynthesis
MSGPGVVLIHYTFPGVPGGVEMVMARHAAALRDAGARVTIVAGRGTLPVRGVRRHRIAELDSRHPRVERIFRALARGSVPDDHERLARSLQERLGPLLRVADRIVVHNALTLHKNPPLGAALHRLAPTLRGRLIVWVHDLAWTNPQYAEERHAGEPWDLFARPADGARYVAVSEQRRDETARLLRISPAEIAVVPNGVDRQTLARLSAAGSRLAERLRLSDAYPILLLPARLTRRKRIEVAIEAAAELARRGLRPRLVVTGSPGPHNAQNALYLEELRTAAKRARGSVVLVHDVVGRPVPYRVLADLYALADALVFPSESEGFGIPLLEAAATRTPIVCSDIPAHRAIAGDDATYVARDAGASELADAIQTTLRQDRAARLRSRVLDEYDWAAVLRDRVVPLVLDGIRRRTA